MVHICLVDVIKIWSLLGFCIQNPDLDLKSSDIQAKMKEKVGVTVNMRNSDSTKNTDNSKHSDIMSQAPPRLSTWLK